jgi:hypothetical protein
VARLIGDAYIVIFPQTDQFGPLTAAAVKKATAAIRGNVPVSPQLDKAAAAKVEADLKALAANIPVSAYLDKASAAKIAAEIKSWTDDVRLGVNLPIGQLTSIRSTIESYMRNNVRLGFSVDPAQLAFLRNQVGTYMRNNSINLGFTVDPVKLAAMKATIDALLRNAVLDVTPMISPATLAAVWAKAQAFATATPVNLNVSTTGAMAKIAALGAYTRQVLSNAGTVGLNFGSAIAQALTFRAAVASLNTTFGKLNALSAATAIATSGLTNLWAAFFTSAGTGWAGLTGKITLFAGVLNQVLPKALSQVSVWHLAADWVLEFAAVFIPATLAVTAFGAAIAPVLLDAKNRLQAMQEAASALGVSIGVFNYNTKGAVGPMQQLQNLLQPTVWELTGDAINVMTSKTGAFQKIVMQVNTVVEDLAARMTAAFSSPSAQTFMQNGALDFQRFGTIIGNLGGALGNFLKDVPGYAEIIQELFVKISAGIEWFTAIAGPIIKAGLAMHGFFLYVGLAATAGVSLIASLGNVTAKFFAFATSATDIGAIGRTIATAFLNAGISIAAFGERIGLLLSNPYVVAIAAIGLAAYAIVTNFNSATTSVTNFANNLTSKIDNLQGGDALKAIPDAMNQINIAIQKASSPQAYQQLASNWNNLGNTFNSFAKDSVADQRQWGKAFSDFGQVLQGNLGDVKGWIDAVGNGFKDMFSHAGISLQVSDNVKALETAFSQLSTQEQNLLTVTGQLMLGTLKIPGTNQLAASSTFNYAQSLGILNAAGVQAGDSLQIMQVKVAGLLVGWKQYGLNATQIGNAVNAISLQTEMQQSSISKLTGAYSNFIGVLTGGESTFATFGEGLGTMQQALSSAGASGVSFSDTLGKFRVTGTAVGATMNGITQASLNARGAFATEITNATGLYNSLLTLSSVSAQGAQGQALLAQAGKDMVAVLLPLAKGSDTAMTEVSGLAQLAGGPATTSFQKLSQWVGNTKNPMQDLNKIEGILTQTSVSLQQDTQNLAGAMGQTLTTAISNAIFAAEKGPQALQALANAMQALATGNGSVAGVETALIKTIPALVEMTGSGNAAKNQFLALAGALHISQQQATAIWNAVAPGANALSAVAKAAQVLTTATNANFTAFTRIPGTLATSTNGYNQLWAAIVKSDTSLMSSSNYASIAKNAFISYAENGLNFNAAAANRLWASNKAQNLITLAGQAATTKSAFIDMAKNGLGLTTSQATTLWSTLRLQYLDTLVAKGKGAENEFISLAKNGLNLSTTAATNLWATMRNQYLDTLASKANTTTQQFVDLAKQLGVGQTAALNLWTSLRQLPKTVQIAVDETIAGGGRIVVQGNIVANQSTGIATSTVTGEQTFNGYAYAAGGVVPAGGGPAA